MTMIDDDRSLTTADLYEELIFLIATASTDTQRKRATELFRDFARRVVVDAYRQGKDSAREDSVCQDRVRPAVAVTPQVTAVDADVAAAASGTTLAPDHLVSLIPMVSWQD